MSEKKCNMCGKTFDEWDEQEDFSMERSIGYGSRYDLCHLRLNLCCNCMDRIIDLCVIPPVKDLE